MHAYMLDTHMPHIRSCMHEYGQTYIHIYKHAYLHATIQTCTRIYTHTQAYGRTCMRVYMLAYMDTHTYISLSMHVCVWLYL